MSSFEYVRQKSDDEERADARVTVATAARNGELPSSTFPSEDLAWAFDGYALELEQLEQLARERQAALASSRDSAETGLELRRETERVLEEWDERDRLERREKAYAEARKRLGL